MRPLPPARRARARAAVLAALVVGATACSSLAEAPAATVEGTEISTDSINEEIETIRDNESYIARLEESYGSSEGAAGEGTFDAAFVAQILTLRVWYELLERDIEEHGLESVLEEVVGDLESTIPEQFDAAFGEGSFESFPASYRAEIIRQQALPEVIQRDVADEIGDDPEAFFDDNPDEFAEICVSHILISLQGESSPDEAVAEARALQERIEDGEDFADVAADESDDPGSAAAGGELECGSRFSLQFDPGFEAAAFALEEGVVSDPVVTQFGAHLIVVTDRQVPDFDDVAGSVPSVMEQALGERFNQRAVDAICDAEVSINPRYGTWAATGCDAPVPEIPRIEPPEGPMLREPEGLEFEL